MKSNRLIPNLALFATLTSAALCVSGCLWAVIGPMQGLPFTFDHFLMTCGAFVIFVGALIITVESVK